MSKNLNTMPVEEFLAYIEKEHKILDGALAATDDLVKFYVERSLRHVRVAITDAAIDLRCRDTGAFRRPLAEGLRGLPYNMVYQWAVCTGDVVVDGRAGPDGTLVYLKIFSLDRRSCLYSWEKSDEPNNAAEVKDHV